jgi:hypothetical protein
MVDHLTNPLSGQKRLLSGFILVAVFALGLFIRVIDLTDPPLDFNPTRQLRSAIITRGLYYEHLSNADSELRADALRYAKQMGIYEPSILEHITAWTYRLIGGEHLWITRLYTIAIWMIGGVGLWYLAKQITNTGASILSLGFYLFLPFSVFASRSFQPDPLMVASIIFSALALHRWGDERSWKLAISAGLVGGIAILVKAAAVFFIAGMALSVILTNSGIRANFRNWQVWVMGGLMVIPAGIYYGAGTGEQASSLFLNWTLDLSYLWSSPSFYMRWLIRVDSLMGLVVFFLGLAGTILAKPKGRAVLIGLWTGYGLYGLFFPHQITTHDYYHLALVPIVSLSLAPIATLILTRLEEQSKIWRIVFVGVILVVVAYPTWMARSILVSQDFRHEPPFWQEVGESLPRDGKVIALTQDYGHRLMYYGWRKASIWPNKAQQNLSDLRGNPESEFDMQFKELTEGMSYFLITSFSQLDSQPLLKVKLQEEYPVFSEREGYIIYDLRLVEEDS